MPRIRTIKPEFFTSDTVSELPLRARLTWIGLWTHCDDYGRCRDNVKLVKAAVWPLDAVSLRDVEEDLEDLIAQGLLYRYACGGKTYLQVTSWTEHQKVDRPSKSAIPAPEAGTLVNGSGRHQSNDTMIAAKPVDNPHNSSSIGTREDSTNTREDASSTRDGKGKEQGKEGRGDAREDSARTPAPTDPGPKPPLTCQEHRDDPDPPACRRCKTAREAAAAWDLADGQRRRDAPDCARHPGSPAHNCGPCRSEQIGAE